MPASNNNAAANQGGKSNTMSSADASRIQSTQAKGGKDMSADCFAARAQGAGDKNANEKK
ncbi:hypothetical protein HBI70_236440 [Parastagonospora nodorum]|nr:hypothetical protein HBH51_227970 [Parastagonospora nodorum]KAH4012141.1 hypothetical protein HBI09_224590 [Parastagonospora nodorum]KAH4215779.1 hypothetical protein HBI06_240490 [Parastagonospora nodorum]KAH4225320.1 hypothetical protein HBI05_229830 [Parastagonospora nodorum]KAH4798842.1 hypothetical protein HBH61_238030 [Parastagonospora nodorum]